MTKKQIRKQYSCKRIKDSYTAKRVEELDTNKIQMVLRMFFTAIYRGLRVDYVLVDSWFTCVDTGYPECEGQGSSPDRDVQVCKD